MMRIWAAAAIPERDVGERGARCVKPDARSTTLFRSAWALGQMPCLKPDPPQAKSSDPKNQVKLWGNGDPGLVAWVVVGAFVLYGDERLKGCVVPNTVSNGKAR
jgi:hypothetical protein